jgi:hypothetical protein
LVPPCENLPNVEVVASGDVGELEVPTKRSTDEHIRAAEAGVHIERIQLYAVLDEWNSERRLAPQGPR